MKIPEKALGRLRLHPEVIGNTSAMPPTTLQTDSDDGGGGGGKRKKIRNSSDNKYYFTLQDPFTNSYCCVCNSDMIISTHSSSVRQVGRVACKHSDLRQR